jgi:hypothetical protein
MIPLSDFTGAKLMKLAPDLDFPNRAGANGYDISGAIDASGGLTTVMNITEKSVIDLMKFINLTAESITIKLTVDGAVLWDVEFTCPTTLTLLGGVGSNEISSSTSLVCESSAKLEIQTATDTEIYFQHLARPIT